MVKALERDYEGVATLEKDIGALLTYENRAVHERHLDLRQPFTRTYMRKLADSLGFSYQQRSIPSEPYEVKGRSRKKSEFTQDFAVFATGEGIPVFAIGGNRSFTNFGYLSVVGDEQYSVMLEDRINLAFQKADRWNGFTGTHPYKVDDQGRVSVSQFLGTGTPVAIRLSEDYKGVGIDLAVEVIQPESDYHAEPSERIVQTFGVYLKDVELQSRVAIPFEFLEILGWPRKGRTKQKVETKDVFVTGNYDMILITDRNLLERISRPSLFRKILKR